MGAIPSADLTAPAPIRTKCSAATLPLDILHYLFTTTYARYDESGLLTDDPDVDDFVLQISQVCQFWRNVALGTPLLWSTIIFTPRDAERGFERQVVWVERSRQIGVDIWVDGYPAEDGGPAGCISLDIMREIRDIILPVVHQWRWLMLASVPLDAIWLLFDGLQNISVPSLVKLLVDPPDLENAVAASAPAFDFSITAPNLLEAWVAQIPAKLSLPILRASSLRKLFLSDLTFSADPNVAVAEILEVVKNLDSLEVLDMENLRAWPETNEYEVQLIQSPPIVHDGLQHLQNIHRTILNGLLPSLEIPHLHELSTVSFATYSILHNLEVLPNLRKLGICDQMDTTHEEGVPRFAEILSLFPNLESLEIAGFDFNEPGYLKFLERNPSKLRTVEFVVCIGLSRDKLHDLIRSRIAADDGRTTRLSEMTVRACGISVVEGMETWQELLSLHLDTFTLNVH